MRLSKLILAFLSLIFLHIFSKVSNQLLCGNGSFPFIVFGHFNICNSNSSNIHLIKALHTNKVKTSGIPIQIKRALQNIFDNAKRYADKIEIDLGIKNNELYIAISDNGPGIPEKNYEDVFKPFFTLDPSRNKLKGESGLGLTITRDIIRSHGGEIKLLK